MSKMDVEQHFWDNFKTYILVTIFFIVGIVMGTIIDITISPSLKSAIAKYVMGFLNYKDHNLSNVYLLKLSMLSNLKMLALIWILGASVLGFPIILFVIGYKGFAIGFCSTFFIEKFKLKGFLFVFLTIFPQNIIIIPCLVIAGVIAIKFSKYILDSLTGRKNMLKGEKSFHIGEYTIIYLVLFAFLSCSSLIEAYLIPAILKLPLFKF